MSPRAVLVIGVGVAGTAAAVAASKAGASVTVVAAVPGASSLMSGAADLLPWELPHAMTAPLPDTCPWRGLLDDLDLWRVGDTPARLASLAGILRPARGRDRALLDLAPLRSARIAVPRVARPSFNADLLVRGWNADPLAEESGLRFEAVDVPGLLLDAELHAPDTIVARAFDDSRRVQLAAASLAGTLDGFVAVLLGPWLGIETDAASTLGRALDRAVGEPLSALAGSAGARFESASARLIAAHGLTRVEDTVAALRRGPRWRAELEHGSAVEADAVVVATGGMISGGIEFAPSGARESDEFPEPPTRAFRTSFACDELCLRIGGAAVEAPGSLHGPNLEDLRWPGVAEERAVFERVGIRCDASLCAVDETGAPITGCMVAGTAVAEAHHTVIASLISGWRAGERAARD